MKKYTETRETNANPFNTRKIHMGQNIEDRKKDGKKKPKANQDSIHCPSRSPNIIIPHIKRPSLTYTSSAYPYPFIRLVLAQPLISLHPSPFPLLLRPPPLPSKYSLAIPSPSHRPPPGLTRPAFLVLAAAVSCSGRYDTTHRDYLVWRLKMSGSAWEGRKCR